MYVRLDERILENMLMLPLNANKIVIFQQCNNYDPESEILQIQNIIIGFILFGSVLEKFIDIC